MPKPPHVDVLEPNEFDLKSADELEAMIVELGERGKRENLPPALVEKFTRKLRAEAGRRRWRTTLANARAQRSP